LNRVVETVFVIEAELEKKCTRMDYPKRKKRGKLGFESII
jgi:hypothetical protein